MSVTIYIADDHGLMREGLCAVLAREPELEVVGQGASGREAIAAIRELRPDVVIMDVAMGDMNGMEATRQVLKDMPESRVIAVSSYSGRRYVLGMLKAGALGYVVKAEAFDQLRLAIREVLRGNVYLSHSVCPTVVDLIREEDTPDPVEALLSARERQIVQLVAEGCSSSLIGEKLNISPSTVETHRRNIMRKLNLHNVAELTRFAIREGITTADG
jgi:DNA-binding NarL/FixJ family response regulator